MQNRDLLLAASTSAYGHYPLAVAVEDIAQAGYRYIEIACTDGLVQHVTDESMTPKMAQGIRGLLERYGLRTYAFSAHMNLLPADSIERFSRRMKFAKEIGARVIVTNIAPQHYIHEFRERLILFSRVASEIDIILCLESPGHLLTPIGKLLDLLREIGSPYVSLNYDIGNVFTASLGKVDPATELPIAMVAAELLHVKDAFLRGDTWRFCPVGEGEVNYDVIFSLIRNSERHIPMTVEMPLHLEGKGSDPAYILNILPTRDELLDGLRRSRLFIEGRLN